MRLIVLGDEILRAVRLFQVSGLDLGSNLRALWKILSDPMYKPFILTFHEHRFCESGAMINADLKLRFAELNVALGRLTSMIVEVSDIPEADKRGVLHNLREILEGLSYAQALIEPVWNENIVSSSILKVLRWEQKVTIRHFDHQGAGVC